MMGKLNRAEALGISLILAISIMTVLSLLLEEYFGRSSAAYSPPSPENLLGTDDLGDDVLRSLLRGSRVSLSIGILGSVFSTLIGGLIGVFSGFMGGALDDLLSSLIDLFMILPALPLMIVLAAYLGPSLLNVIIVIGLLWWPATARLVRARARQIRESPFIEGLICLGAGKLYIILRHVLPNVWGIILARFVLSVPGAILLESGLSFIGLGDPRSPSWGMMLHFAMTRGSLLRGAWWTFVPPGLCITVTSLGFILLGMGLEQRYKLSTKSVEGLL
jgi:ABC-type dipeptide/oligopeptide/nickel transport system permease subunit